MARVLIVDDSLMMRRNLKTLITQAGHDVIGEAADGSEACSAYAKHQPDLVTMDITMPKMDGIAAVKQIIQDHPQARIIMVSAVNQQEMVFEAIKSGAKNYVLKPINAEQLNGVIQTVLEK
jgi:YesN/AraC family two-component response regulator